MPLRWTAPEAFADCVFGEVCCSHPLPWAPPAHLLGPELASARCVAVTLYHGHPLPISLAGARTRFVTARLSLRQEGRTRVKALVEGEGVLQFHIVDR